MRFAVGLDSWFENLEYDSMEWILKTRSNLICRLKSINSKTYAKQFRVFDFKLWLKNLHDVKEEMLAEIKLKYRGQKERKRKNEVVLSLGENVHSVVLYRVNDVVKLESSENCWISWKIGFVSKIFIEKLSRNSEISVFRWTIFGFQLWFVF